MTFPAVDSARFDAAARTGSPVLKLPSVNLLSPKTLQRLAVRRVRRRLVAGGLVAVVFVGGGWMVQSARLDSAHQQLTDAQAATAPLNAQLSALTPIATFYSELDARKTAASQAMAAEVLFSAALADLNTRTPKNMLITNLAVTLTPSVVTAVAPPVSPLTKAGIDASGNDTTPAAAQAAASGTGAASASVPTSSTPATGSAATASASAGASCAQQDPFDPTAVIGCITLSGNAPSRAVVGNFITNLKASQLYATPFITTTTATGANGVQQVQFSGSVGLTSAAVSGRYADLSWLADPSVLAAAQAMIDAGNTASNRLAKETAALQALQQAEAAAAAKAQAAAAAAAQLAAQNAAAQQLRAAAAAALAASQAASTSQSSSTTTTTTTKGS